MFEWCWPTLANRMTARHLIVTKESRQWKITPGWLRTYCTSTLDRCYLSIYLNLFRKHIWFLLRLTQWINWLHCRRSCFIIFQLFIWVGLVLGFCARVLLYCLAWLFYLLLLFWNFVSLGNICTPKQFNIWSGWPTGWRWRSKIIAECAICCRMAKKKCQGLQLNSFWRHCSSEKTFVCKYSHQPTFTSKVKSNGCIDDKAQQQKIGHKMQLHRKGVFTSVYSFNQPFKRKCKCQVVNWAEPVQS